MAGPTTLEDLFQGFEGLDWYYQLLFLIVGGSLLMGALQPYMQELQKLGFSAFPTVPPTPPLLADLVVRGYMDPSTAATLARQSGMDADTFSQTVQSVGQAPPLQALFDAYHRGAIPMGADVEIGPPGTTPPALSVTQGIREGHIADKWIPVIQAIAEVWPTAGQAVVAAVRNQLTRDQALALYQQVGGAKQWFDLLFNITGNPISPLEAATLVHRGIIPQHGTGPDATTFDQAVAESDLKDKWGPYLWQLSTYLPPPRTIVAQVRDGAMDDATAAKYLAMAGLQPDLAKSYIAEGHTSKTATTKALAESTVHALYVDQLIDQASARVMLEALRYTQKDSDFILAVWDLQYEQKAITAAVSKVRSQYIAHKISQVDANNALNTLQIPPAQVGQLLHVWALERQANVRTLTPSEIANGFHYGITSLDDTLASLQQIGYSAYDAWLFVSIHEHEKQGNPPPRPAYIVGPGGAGG